MSQGALSRYRTKRDFAGSPEPRGAVPRGRGNPLRFYVQKHAARALHYDVRLEMGGVLHSWAVPKGPSLKVGEKRLAVEVEDHPLEYGTFEGVIPKGHYGAGTVEVWDQGIWIPDGDPTKDLARGHLTFRLEGGRLQGTWSLIRMRPDERGKKVHWLLIRSRKASPAAAPKENAAAPPRRESPVRTFIAPELATLVAAAPEGDEWIHELKFDGYRVIAELDGSDVRLLTRTGLDWTSRFPSLQKALRKLRSPGTTLDGEVVVLNEKGVSDFAALQKALSEGRTDGLIYYVFDLLRQKGQDLRELPLLNRKKRLLKSLSLNGSTGTIRLSDHFRGSGDAVKREACRLGLEGIISKRADSPYRSGRGGDWVKVKCVKEQEFVIGGYTDPGGTREGLGALLLGVHGPDGRFLYAGRVGTGFDDAVLRDLRKRLAALETTRPPYDEGPGGAERRGVHWVQPLLLAQIRFAGWTPDHRLRHPVFHGLREDKPAAEVGEEVLPPQASAATVAGVAISHPDRIVYPEQRLTKLDVARYYDTIADRMLPFVADRPLSLLRCPQGRGGACFYQKHWQAPDDDVKIVRITGRSGAGSYPVISSASGLVRFVQQGVLELHPWGCRARSVERPDVCVFDLDPSPEISWPDLADAARRLRALLGSMDLEAYLKTTGGKGLHLVVPLSGALRWERVKTFSREIADRMVREHPDRFTATLSKKARKGRIFIDWLRNGRGATAVAPYSTRARPHAPLAMPIGWEELSTIDRADTFTLRTIAERLKRDPWKDYFKVRQTLPKTGRVF